MLLQYSMLKVVEKVLDQLDDVLFCHPEVRAKKFHNTSNKYFKYFISITDQIYSDNVNRFHIAPLYLSETSS